VGNRGDVKKAERIEFFFDTDFTDYTDFHRRTQSQREIFFSLARSFQSLETAETAEKNDNKD